MRPTPKPNPSLQSHPQLRYKQSQDALGIHVVVDEEAPERYLFVLSPAQTTAIHVGAHLDGHLELQAAVAEECEEQPRVELGEGTVVIGISTPEASVL